MAYAGGREMFGLLVPCDRLFWGNKSRLALLGQVPDNSGWRLQGVT